MAPVADLYVRADNDQEEMSTDLHFLAATIGIVGHWPAIMIAAAGTFAARRLLRPAQPKHRWRRTAVLSAGLPPVLFSVGTVIDFNVDGGALHIDCPAWLTLICIYIPSVLACLLAQLLESRGGARLARSEARSAPIGCAERPGSSPTEKTGSG